MEQYINKSALVAEIKKRIKDVNRLIEIGCNNKEKLSLETVLIESEKIQIYEDILDYINILEVKDIDLKKESELIANGIMIDVQANKYHTCVYNTERCDFNHSHLMLAARKGIELGLKQIRNSYDNN